MAKIIESGAVFGATAALLRVTSEPGLAVRHWITGCNAFALSGTAGPVSRAALAHAAAHGARVTARRHADTTFTAESTRTLRVECARFERALGRAVAARSAVVGSIITFL